MTRDEAAASRVQDWLWKAFETGVRGDLFDRLLAAQRADLRPVSVADMVQAYRTHDPAIGLLPGTADLLDDLRRQGVRLGVLSDGPLASQQAKSTALDLPAWFDPIVLTDARVGMAKPAITGFEWIASQWALPATTMAYVGDNPLKDFAGPRRLGWRTVRVRMPLQVTCRIPTPDDARRPDVEVPDLRAAVAYLRS